MNMVAAAAIDSPALERSVRRKLEANRLGDCYIYNLPEEKKEEKSDVEWDTIYKSSSSVMVDNEKWWLWTSSADGGAFAYRLEIEKKDPWPKRHTVPRDFFSFQIGLASDF